MLTEEGSLQERPWLDLAALMFVECIGTFVLVLAGTSAVVSSTLQVPLFGIVVRPEQVPIIFGFTLCLIAYTIGPLSGCHLNPMLTVALIVAGKFHWLIGAAYILAQFIGAAVGSLLLGLWLGDRAYSQTLLGAPIPKAGMQGWEVLGVEFLFSLLLALVVVSANDSRAAKAITPLTVGFALYAAVLLAGPLTGGGVNPARSLAPMLIAAVATHHLDPSWWAYLFGPLLGGVAAGIVRGKLLMPVSPLV